ncbi:MAG: putative toxin-antitoxin system toxin component, PIN family [Candidatus Omnitrophica bacterium]|nr:putative toxin-antitoxin system toxin component, PIN family [Candidatus Omnitrophota bacterium]MBU4479224.1 putative toxin-antitoxin system toxin component, PIN family [Candidatus Omnitrophota bacterium]MCG2703914.1 putative toxin-antitoxin system toxin component, PIN family [Candidatus Omnitrophota bacterium]
MGKKEVKTRKVIIDTNVVISALLFEGQANEIFSLWKNGRVVFLASKEMITEYIKVLSYPKFNLTNEEIKYLLQEELVPFIKPVKVSTAIDVIKDDPSDNKFLSAAVDGKADYIISGDKHLLNLKKFRKIEIVSITEFLKNYI